LGQLEPTDHRQANGRNLAETRRRSGVRQFDSPLNRF
jgi:hypothetical protein